MQCRFGWSVKLRELQNFDLSSRRADDVAMRKRALFFYTILLSAIGNISAAQSPSQPQDTYRPAATIRDIMVMMVDPGDDYIWQAVSTEIGAAGAVQKGR